MQRNTTRSAYATSTLSKICAVLSLLWLMILAVLGAVRGSVFPYEMWLLLGMTGIWGGAAMLRALTPPHREGA